MPTGGKIGVTCLGSLEAAAAVDLAALVLAGTPQPCRQCHGGCFWECPLVFCPVCLQGCPGTVESPLELERKEAVL